MVSAELGMSAGSLDSARTAGAWMVASLPTTGWSEHGAQLARAMNDYEFYAVMEAATKVAATRPSPTSRSLTPRLPVSDS
jgi:hypothetical protein